MTAVWFCPVCRLLVAHFEMLDGCVTQPGWLSCPLSPPAVIARRSPDWDENEHRSFTVPAAP